MISALMYLLGCENIYGTCHIWLHCQNASGAATLLMLAMACLTTGTVQAGLQVCQCWNCALSFL